MFKNEICVNLLSDREQRAVLDKKTAAIRQSVEQNETLYPKIQEQRCPAHGSPGYRAGQAALPLTPRYCVYF